MSSNHFRLGVEQEGPPPAELANAGMAFGRAFAVDGGETVGKARLQALMDWAARAKDAGVEIDAGVLLATVARLPQPPDAAPGTPRPKALTKVSADRRKAVKAMATALEAQVIAPAVTGLIAARDELVGNPPRDPDTGAITGPGAFSRDAMVKGTTAYQFVAKRASAMRAYLAATAPVFVDPDAGLAATLFTAAVDDAVARHPKTGVTATQLWADLVPAKIRLAAGLAAESHPDLGPSYLEIAADILRQEIDDYLSSVGREKGERSLDDQVAWLINRLTTLGEKARQDGRLPLAEIMIRAARQIEERMGVKSLTLAPETSEPAPPPAVVKAKPAAAKPKPAVAKAKPTTAKVVI
jgi:hypothetical protein